MKKVIQVTATFEVPFESTGSPTFEQAVQSVVNNAVYTELNTVGGVYLYTKNIDCDRDDCTDEFRKIKIASKVI